MKTQENLFNELEIKMDEVVFRYENLFKSSKQDPQEFLQNHYEAIRSELARLATDTLHESIVSGIGIDEMFTFNVQKLNLGSVYKLMLTMTNNAS